MKSSEKTTEIKFSRKIAAAVMAVLYLAASSPVAAFAEDLNAVSKTVPAQSPFQTKKNRKS